MKRIIIAAILLFPSQAQAGKNIPPGAKPAGIKGTWHLKSQVLKFCEKKGTCYGKEKFPGTTSFGYYASVKGTATFSGDRRGTLFITTITTYTHPRKPGFSVIEKMIAKYVVVHKNGITTIIAKQKNGAVANYIVKMHNGSLKLTDSVPSFLGVSFMTSTYMR